MLGQRVAKEKNNVIQVRGREILALLLRVTRVPQFSHHRLADSQNLILRISSF